MESELPSCSARCPIESKSKPDVNAEDVPTKKKRRIADKAPNLSLKIPDLNQRDSQIANIISPFQLSTAEIDRLIPIDNSLPRTADVLETVANLESDAFKCYNGQADSDSTKRVMFEVNLGGRKVHLPIHVSISPDISENSSDVIDPLSLANYETFNLSERCPETKKLLRVREQNKVAAKTYRKRKKMALESLADENALLKNQNENLMNQVKELKSENNLLRIVLSSMSNVGDGQMTNVVPKVVLIHKK